MEADFQRFYQRDLADLWRGTLSVRKAGVWATHLPPEAAVYRLGPDDALWSSEKQELVSIRDDIRRAVYEAPEPLPRPGDAERRQAEDAAIWAKAARFRQRST